MVLKDQAVQLVSLVLLVKKVTVVNTVAKENEFVSFFFLSIFFLLIIIYESHRVTMVFYQSMVKTVFLVKLVPLVHEVFPVFRAVMDPR